MNLLWERFERLPGWSAGWSLLPDGAHSATDWKRKLILLDVRLTYQEARSALAVELERRDRGPKRWCPFPVSVRELERAAARWLIPMEELIAAASMSADPEVVADLLGVNECLLNARMDGLTMEERARLMVGVDCCGCDAEDCWLVLAAEP